MNIVLIGMPASGKTTVAKILGKSLGVKVLDTDALIVKNHGNITKIFSSYGEVHFRNLESTAVRQVARKKNAVISTGGGCPLRKKNVFALKNSGKIIYLRTSVAELTRRTEGDSSRPLLKGEREERLKSLLSVRTPVYEKAADFIIDTDGLTPEEIAKKITEFIK